MNKTFTFRGMLLNDALIESYEQAGYKYVEDIEDAKVVFTYCEIPNQTEEMYFGDSNLTKKLNDDAYLVDLSANTTSFARMASSLAQVDSYHAIDAPLMFGAVLSSDFATKKEKITSFVGSNEEEFAFIKPWLEVIAGQVSYQGKAGMGQLARAGASLVLAAQVLSLVEASALTDKMDLDACGFIEDLYKQNMLSEYTYALSKAIQRKSFEQGMPTRVFLGELLAAAEVADESYLVLPHAEAARRLLEMYMIAGGADLNLASLAALYRGHEYAQDYALNWQRLDEVLSDDEEHEHNHVDEALQDNFGYDDYDDYDDYDEYDDEDDDF